MKNTRFASWPAVSLGLASLFPLVAQDADLREAGRALANPHELLAAPAPHVLEIALGDVDGDGDLDAFLGGGYVYPGGLLADENGLWINDGTGRFTDGNRRLPELFELTAAALLVDLTGDARPEVLVASRDEPDRVLLNNGYGNFTELAGVLPDPGSSECFAAADVDGDGDEDLVCGRDGQDRLYLNTGAGRFVDRTSWLPVDTERTHDLELTDVDGNLGVDIVAAHDARLALFLNDGTGHFTDASANVPGGAYWVDSGDVETDGDLDLISSGVVLRNDGTGVFTGEVAIGGGDFWDADGDGDLDLLSPTTLCLNDGTGSFTDASNRLPQLNDTTYGWAVQDLDGDADPDYVLEKVHADYITGITTHRSHLVLNDGDAFFEEATAWSIELPRRRANGGALADMDGDGDLDVVTGARRDGPGGTWEHKFFLFHNDGFGRFTDRTEDLLPFEWTLVQSVALGDVDKDGDRDIVLGGEDNWDGEGGGCRLFLNQGAAGFTDATNQVPVFQNAVVHDVLLADVDGDLDLDILQVAEGYPPFPDMIFVNDGTGHFTVSATFTPSPEDTFEAAFVDVDGDNDLDVLSAGADLRFFRNDGLGAFTDQSANLPAGNGTCLGVGDVDGDGDVDLVVGRVGIDELYRNDGTGLFTSAGGAFSPTSRRTDDIALVDLDDDGDVDILALGRDDYNEPYEGRLYLNDGSGTFAKTHLMLPREFAGETLSFGDVDEDGDLDVLTCGPGWGFGRLWSNLARHVAWRWLPRAGRTLRLDLTGRPGDPWLLAYALGTTRIPLGFGVLFLDPFTAVIAGAGTLSIAGDHAFTTPVPSDPALIGISVYWQALLGHPPRLTNLETTTITGL